MQFNLKSNRFEARKAVTFPVALMPTSEIAPQMASLSHLQNAVVGTLEGEQRIFALRGSTYGLTPFKTVLDEFEGAIENFDYVVRYRHSQDFGELFADYTFVAGKTYLDKKDAIRPQVTLIHSYAGRAQREVSFGMYRVVCDNGLSLPIGNRNVFKKKHTLNAAKKTNLMELVTEFIDNAANIATGYNKLIFTLVEDLEVRINGIASLTGFPKVGIPFAINRAQKEFEKGFGKTDWVVYNALNYVLTHNYIELKTGDVERLRLDRLILDTMLK